LITTAAAGASSVYATDLDGDGDADVLSASGGDDKIAWYENLGGGAFGAQQVITTAADNAKAVYATDLDGDGNADVLSASRNDNKIAWYENLEGGAFGAQQVITTAADGAYTVYATDLDGDGDADVLSASADDDKIAWYENLGGGAFGAQQVITTAANGAWSVYATDLDGDGDADVVSASFYDDKIAWYENQIFDCDGNGVHDPYDIAGDPSLDWNGDGIIDSCPGGSPKYCYSNLNQFGLYGEIRLEGSPVITANNFTLIGENLPTNVFGYFLFSMNQGLLDPFGGGLGVLCLGPPIKRFNTPLDGGAVLHSGSTGVMSFSPDLFGLPQNVVLQPGDLWNFQLWHREWDPATGVPTSNTTDAVTVMFR